jgi:hypothetical protein
MRVFQVTPHGLTYLFDANHNHEAAKHASFGAPFDPGDAGFKQTLESIADAMGEATLEIHFEPIFSDIPEMKSDEEQLDQLGDIVENVSILAGMYAAMVAEARGHVDDEA